MKMKVTKIILMHTLDDTHVVLFLPDSHNDDDFDTSVMKDSSSSSDEDDLVDVDCTHADNTC